MSEPEQKPDLGLEHLRAVSQQPPAKLNVNLYYSVNELRITLEGLGLAIINFEVDTAMLPGSVDENDRLRLLAHTSVIKTVMRHAITSAEKIQGTAKSLLASD